jgi:hypothetical protein
MKQTMIYVLALLTFVPGTWAIKVLDRDINEYCKPGELLEFSNDTDSNMGLKIKNGNLLIGSASFNNTNFIHDRYAYLKGQKRSLTSDLDPRPDNNIYLFKTYAQHESALVLKADEIIDINSSIVKAPLVELTADKIKFSKSFIKTRILRIKPCNPHSIVNDITIIFNTDTTLPPYAEVKLDFITDEPVCELILFGARKIQISFKPEAFNKLPGRKLASNYGTHMACLMTAAAHTDGPILEMGAGDYSTPLLHALCSKDQRYLLSTDTDKEWLSYFTDLATDWHEFKHVKVYTDDKEKNPQPRVWDTIGNDRHWSVVFIDHKPGERRAVDIERLRYNTDIFVVHDTEQLGYNLEQVLRSFKHRHDDTRYTTRTTVLSDTIPVEDLFNIKG